MDEVPFYEKPWFTSVVLFILLAGIYGYEIWQGGVWNNLLSMAFDLGLMVVLLFPVCVFFYAQFILPIYKREDRAKIVNRLWLHFSKAHGPAIFVRNGRLVESPKESERKGPGVLWLDSASAVVTRTPTALKNILAPGVHFTDKDEEIATVISLHTQTQRMGPLEGEDPFEKLKENATEEEKKKHNEAQARRLAVSAMTRDGIEVVPSISVTFKIDAKPAKSNEKGSRFGFDKDAVAKAARGEGVDAASKPDELKRVAWNQLPGLIAADLWREYLAKFTLNELFSPTFEPAPDVPQPEIPLPQPEPAKAAPSTKYDFFSGILKNINDSLERRLPKAEPAKESIASKDPETPIPASKSGAKPQTALQIINQMMKARMTQSNVAKLDDSGRLVEGFEASREYNTLKERGVKVLGVSVSGLRFTEEVETQLVRQWKTSWLANATADRKRIERLKLTNTLKGQQKALQDHALTLSQAILKDQPRTIAAALKSLLERTESEVKLNDRLLRRTTNEVGDLDELINWVES
jgi:hypothetical protein